MKDYAKDLITSIEKIFRYIMPGAAFCLLYAISHPEDFTKRIGLIQGNEILAFFLVLTIGMSIYVVHSQLLRFTFEMLAFIFRQSSVIIFSHCCCDYLNSYAKLLYYERTSETYPKEYFIYLWSLVHYSFMMSELLIIF